MCVYRDIYLYQHKLNLLFLPLKNPGPPGFASQCIVVFFLFFVDPSKFGSEHIEDESQVGPQSHRAVISVGFS